MVALLCDTCPSNTRRWRNVCLMFGQRHRRRANIILALGQRLVLTGVVRIGHRHIMCLI